MLQDLEPKLIDALEELRREFDDKLNQQRQAFERLVGAPPQAIEAEPEPVATEAEPVAVEPGPVADLDPLEELKLAAADIDRSESQGDVLDALIRGAARFSSRTAIFLRRDGAFYGWGGTGFGQTDSTIKGMALQTPEESPWQQIASGEGGVCLSSEDCSVLLDELGADKAEIGVLVPFILRRQVAAVIYSDRTDQDQIFNISGLQLLSFLAGQTVETLPIRERSATSSLQLAVAAAAPEPEVVEDTETEAEIAEGTDEAPVAEPDIEFAAEPEPEPEPEPVEAPEPALKEWGAPGITSPAEEMPTLDMPDEIAPAEDTPVEIEPEAEAEYPPEPDAEPEPEPETEPEPEPGPISEALVANLDPLPELAVPADEQALDAGAIDTGAFDIPPAEPSAPDFEADVTPEPPAPEAVEEAAPDLASPADTPQADSVEPPSPISTQVQPPQDVEGPGWAFTTTRIPTSAGAEALHEEARRLARLLVTEIKLYNEELVEEGRQAGDVYSRLRDDVDRSRQIFDDRIDPEVRSEKDYFREALVRILAGGEPSVLGIPD